jgi:hypothetical protein
VYEPALTVRVKLALRVELVLMASADRGPKLRAAAPAGLVAIDRPTMNTARSAAKRDGVLPSGNSFM